VARRGHRRQRLEVPAGLSACGGARRGTSPAGRALEAGLAIALNVARSHRKRLGSFERDAASDAIDGFNTSGYEQLGRIAPGLLADDYRPALDAARQYLTGDLVPSPDDIRKALGR
jgi:hypothetical protein